jgi:hypothetical protein
LINVTAPVSAYSPPDTVTPSFTEIDASASMLPANVVLVPRVADDPICQKMLHACAPLLKTTLEAVPVVRVDPIWNTNCASALF